jgi:hypothetical protein
MIGQEGVKRVRVVRMLEFEMINESEPTVREPLIITLELVKFAPLFTLKSPSNKNVPLAMSVAIPSKN